MTMYQRPRPALFKSMNLVLPSTVLGCALLWAAFVLLVPHGLLVFALLVVAVVAAMLVLPAARVVRAEVRGWR